MAAFLDGCRFNPTAGGATDWTYSSAVIGYHSPAAAGVVNGTFYKYRAESTDLSQWEFGEGTYNTSTGVLARTTVLFNSSGTGTGSGQSGAGTKISFSTVPQVAIVALAEDLPGLAINNSFSGTQNVTNTADASSSSAGGAFTIAGGLAVAKKFYAGAASFFSGAASFLNSTASTSVTTGAVVVTGGVGIGGGISVGGTIFPASVPAQPHIDTSGAGLTVPASGSGQLTSGNNAGLLCVRENTSTGDYLVAFLGTSGGITVIASIGTWAVGATTPASGHYNIGFSGSAWYIYNGPTTRTFNWSFWRIA